MNKILIISLAGIGDTLFATPLIEELRENYPKSIIDVLVMWKGSEEILKNNPNINSVYKFNMIKEGFFKTFLFCLKLRKKNYDLSINTYPQSNIAYRGVSWVIGATERIGHVYDNFSILDNIFLTKNLDQDYSIHAIENNLNLLRLINMETKIKDHDYKIYLTKENKVRANSFLIEHDLRNEILFGIHAGSGSTKNLYLRRWPLNNYVDLINYIINDNGKINILVFGGPNEVYDNQNIVSLLDNKRVILVNRDNILDAATLIGKCKFFISVDTVMMHIAGAMKVPYQIVIQSPTYNKTVEPYKRKYIYIGKEMPPNIRYKYDGKGIQGNKNDIINYMLSIKPLDVYNKIKKELKSTI